MKPSARRAHPEDLHLWLRTALKHQLKRWRKQVRVCKRTFSEDSVHSLRVEIRRFLSSAELLKAFLRPGSIRKISKLLKRQLDRLDALRDVQVQLMLIDKLRARFAAASRFHRHLLRREERLLRAAQKQARHIRPRRLARLTRLLSEELRARKGRRGAARDFSALFDRLLKRFARAELLRSQIDPSDTETIHRTRVAFKRYRYMAEAVYPWVPGYTKERLATMHHYQTMMGAIQDAEVLMHRFARFAPAQADMDKAERQLLAELARRREVAIRRFMRQANHLSRFGPRSLVSTDLRLLSHA